MITRIEIDGFKSFDHFSLDLQPFTVLAGPNNSGKSNLLEAVELLRDAQIDHSPTPLVRRPRGTGTELLHRTDDGSMTLSMSIKGAMRTPSVLAGEPLKLLFHATAVDVRIAMRARGVKPQNPTSVLDESDGSRLDELLQSWVFVNPDPAATRYGASLDDIGPLANSGDNFAAVVGRILEHADAEDFVLDAQYVIGDLLDVKPVRDKRRNQWDIDVVLRGGRSFTPALVSDGTLRVLALLAALHDPDHRGVVMIEDVENGLHPEYQARLCERLAARTGGGGRQVIATTHSPVVVAAALEQPDSAVVFLDQVAGPVTTADGVLRTQHQTRARRVANGGERGTYVTQTELNNYLAAAGDR